jgi:hypothetical protein
MVPNKQGARIMANEVVKKESSVPAVSTPDVGTEVLLASDMVIPRVLLMQGQSEFVKEGKAKVGQFVRSTNVEVLGDEENPFHIIPLTFIHRWRHDSVSKAGKKKYVRTIARDVTNEVLPYEFEEDGQQMVRTKVIDVFALLAKDIVVAKGQTFVEGTIPSLDALLLPVLISFKSTGYAAGKSVHDLFMRVRKLREKCPTLMAYNYGCMLGCYSDENDSGHFHVPRITSGPNTDPKFLDDCSYWYDLLTRHGQSVKTDDSSLNEGHDAAPASDAAGRF